MVNDEQLTVNSKTILWSIILAVSFFYEGYSAPCQDYACDSLVVRSILDTNGLDSVLVSEVSKLDSLGTRIEGIFFDGRGISIIPDLIGDLTVLKYIDFANNNLNAIPDIIGSLSNLEFFEAPNNQITVIPDTIFSLLNLTNLHLHYNQISIISDSIGNLTNLFSLSFHNNLISDIPTSISNLTKLLSLYLYNNQIASLPVSMGNLSLLKTLYLHENLLTTIPDTLLTLDSLFFVTLGSNKLCLNTENLEAWPAATYGQSGWKDTQDCSTTKRIAKNSLINRFTLNQNSPNPFKPTTSITYNLPKSTPLKLQVFNIRGKLIHTIINTNQPQGKHTTVWDASQHPSGVYYFKLVAGNKVAVRKGVLNR